MSRRKIEIFLYNFGGTSALQTPKIFKTSQSHISHIQKCLLPYPIQRSCRLSVNRALPLMWMWKLILCQVFLRFVLQKDLSVLLLLQQVRRLFSTIIPLHQVNSSDPTS